MNDRRRMGVVTATGLVVASMVGTGVFTTTGYLARDLGSAPSILLCWLVAGLASLCGALCYAELAVAIPQNGGEYRFLTDLFHPLLGFLSAWIALVGGFSAPLALVALAFGEHLARLWPGAPPARAVAAVLIVLLSLLNAWRVSVSARFQDAFTIGKVALIAVFIVVALGYGDASRLADGGGVPLGRSLLSPAFALSLMWVSFAYTGWNAAVYVAGEVRDPEKVLPRALTFGTLLVTALYLGLNAAFLAAAPLGALSGKVEVAHVAASTVLGPVGGQLLTALVALGLVSTVGAIVVTGPRIYEAVGHEVPGLGWLAVRSDGGGPSRAIALQSLLALFMLLAPSFESLLSYIGFTLSLFAGITVCGVFRLRQLGRVGSYRLIGYPFTPLAFVALMIWVVYNGIVERPLAALAGAGTILVGWAVYAITRSLAR